jgi:predicted  nucleic acid-binding Zn-ribbon protein
MVSVIKKLLELQDLDLLMRGIEQELRDIPARKALEEGRLQEHTEALNKAQDELKASHAKVQQLELESESRQVKIRKLRQQQFELKSNKEFKAMDLEIETILGQISNLEDKELVLMDEVEESKVGVDEKSADLKEEAANVALDVAQLDERAAEQAQELEQVQAQRAEAITHVDESWLTHYQRVFDRRGNQVVVPLEGGVCGGCHMTLPPAVMHATHKQDEMVCCEYCGRLLYS